MTSIVDPHLILPHLVHAPQLRLFTFSWSDLDVDEHLTTSDLALAVVALLNATNDRQMRIEVRAPFDEERGKQLQAAVDHPRLHVE